MSEQVTRPPGRVLIVDDDPQVLESMSQLLGRQGYEVQAYASPRDFLRAPAAQPPCCVLLDVEMPEMSGLELQEVLGRTREALPIVFMTGHADVPRSVKAMKAGALDFLLKPFSSEDVLAAVARALGRSATDSARLQALRSARARLDRLTPRERQVCDLVVQGLTSKEIAESLGTAEKTIHVHRQRVMSKTDVASLADLVRLCEVAREDADG